MWMSVFRGIPRLAATFEKQFTVYADYDVHLRRLSPRLLRRRILRPEIKNLILFFFLKGLWHVWSWLQYRHYTDRPGNIRNCNLVFKDWFGREDSERRWSKCSQNHRITERFHSRDLMPCKLKGKCKYHIIHSPQGLSGIIYNTGWGTLPDC